MLVLNSCTTFGYDPHDKPIPKQVGRYSRIKLQYVEGEKVSFTEITKPVNHESGWDDDDIVLVFRSDLIDEEFSEGKWFVWSDSWWTRFRLNLDEPLGYGGTLGCRILDGELRVFVGTKGQFFVRENTIYLIYKEL